MVTPRAEPRRLATGAEPADAGRPADAGFTLIEVIVAVVILTFGLLGLAGTTAWVVRTSTMAEAQTERTMALQTVVEQVRAIDFDDVGSGSEDVGSFAVKWTVTSSTAQSKTVQVVTVGPGMSGTGTGIPSMSNSVADTFYFEVLNP